RFIGLSERIQDEIDMERNLERPITAEVLAGYEVLMLPAPTEPLTASEISAIRQYIADGGSLLLLGDANFGWSNGLTESFGITLNGEPLSEEEGGAFGNVVLQPQIS